MCVAAIGRLESAFFMSENILKITVLKGYVSLLFYLAANFLVTEYVLMQL